jgi:hypothetical protein
MKREIPFYSAIVKFAGYYQKAGLLPSFQAGRQPGCEERPDRERQTRMASRINAAVLFVILLVSAYSEGNGTPVSHIGV